MISKVIATGLALIAASMLVLGTISYWQALVVERWSSRNTSLYGVAAGLSKGALWLVTCTSVRTAPSTPVDTSRQILGFTYFWQQDADQTSFRCANGVARTVGYSRHTCVTLPFWLPALLLAVYPLLTLAGGALRGRRLRRHWRCLKYGYDLTGNVSGRYPECGERTPARCSSGPPTQHQHHDHADK